MNFTTGGLVRGWAKVQPQAAAVVDGYTARQLSYKDLDRLSEQVAWSLYARGIRMGNVVGYLMSSSLDIVVLLIAIGKIGAAWTPLNPHSHPEDWVRQWTHAGAVAVICDEGSKVGEMSMGNILAISWAELSDPAGPGDRFPSPVPASGRAGILYTSGTTGEAKGAWHTHRTLWGWHHSLLATVGITRHDRVINPYPLYHMGGVGFTLATLQAGATVILDTPFEARHLAESIIWHQATVAFLVPTMTEALLDLPPLVRSELGGPWLRQLVATSAPLLSETHQEIEAAWPQLRISVLYSATEAIFSMLRPEDRPSAPICVGRPVFGSSLAILDERHQPCGIDTPGTVYVRGLSVFSGYHRSDDQFLAWHDDWFTCFDVGYRDENGYLYLVDRAKDLINSGGEKISSVEIENVLRSHTLIKEVAVVGLPDPYWGERVHAVVVPKDPALTAEEVRIYARGHLPAYKVPKTVVFQDYLPKTDTGKILKRELRLGAPSSEG